MGTLGEGEPDTVSRAELMACVVAAESTRGNVVHVTGYEILKNRQDRGWPTPRLGQGRQPRSLVAIVSSPGNEARNIARYGGKCANH